MNSGQVCDELEIALHRGDGSETALSYHLNAAEKEVLLRKMEDYCQEQTGMGLVEYSTQVMAEAPEPPTGPAMGLGRLCQRWGAFLVGFGEWLFPRGCGIVCSAAGDCGKITTQEEIT